MPVRFGLRGQNLPTSRSGQNSGGVKNWRPVGINKFEVHKQALTGRQGAGGQGIDIKAGRRLGGGAGGANHGGLRAQVVENQGHRSIDWSASAIGEYHGLEKMAAARVVAKPERCDADLAGDIHGPGGGQKTEDPNGVGGTGKDLPVIDGWGNEFITQTELVARGVLAAVVEFAQSNSVESM
jgi:hypothetical protein